MRIMQTSNNAIIDRVISEKTPFKLSHLNTKQLKGKSSLKSDRFSQIKWGKDTPLIQIFNFD